jgi:hypothetical protein
VTWEVTLAGRSATILVDLLAKKQSLFSVSPQFAPEVRPLFGLQA